MRLAYLCDSIYPFSIGGGEYRNYCLAKNLSQEIDISFYSFNYWSDLSNRNLLSGCRYISIGAPIALYNKRGRRSLWAALTYAFCLIKHLCTSREDVWDIWNIPYFPLLVVRAASLLRKKKLIVTWYEFCGGLMNQYFGVVIGFIFQIVEKIAMRCSPHIVTLSRFTKNRLIQAGMAEEKISVIPWGVDLERVKGIPPFHMGAELIYAGRLHFHKRVDLLIQAVHLLRRQGQTVNLWILGDGPERRRLADLVRQLHLESQITFLGFLEGHDEVYSRMKVCKVLVNPSEREGFGIAVIDAWACGIPAVVCDSPYSALPELIDHPLKGRICQSDAESIASSCKQLLEMDPASFSTYLPTVAAQYDIQIMSQRVKELYFHVAKN